MILAENNLLNAQAEVHAHPTNVHLINLECKMPDFLQKAKEDRDSALRQKAKITWLTLEDENTKFFYQFIKHRHRSSTINVLQMGKEIISEHAKI